MAAATESQALCARTAGRRSERRARDFMVLDVCDSWVMSMVNSIECLIFEEERALDI